MTTVEDQMQQMAQVIQNLSDQMASMRVELDQAKSSAVEADIRADEANARAESTTRLLEAVENLAINTGG